MHALMRTSLTRHQSKISHSTTVALTKLACYSSSAPTRIESTASRTALLFPGQGSQRVGASVRELEQQWPSIVRPIWQELDESLQMNLSRTMKDGLAVSIIYLSFHTAMHAYMDWMC
jgi:hypothetical protein